MDQATIDAVTSAVKNYVAYALQDALPLGAKCEVFVTEETDDTVFFDLVTETDRHAFKLVVEEMLS